MIKSGVWNLECRGYFFKQKFQSRAIWNGQAQRLYRESLGDQLSLWRGLGELVAWQRRVWAMWRWEKDGRMTQVSNFQAYFQRLICFFFSFFKQEKITAGLQMISACRWKTRTERLQAHDPPWCGWAGAPSSDFQTATKKRNRTGEPLGDGAAASAGRPWYFLFSIYDYLPLMPARALRSSKVLKVST